MPNPCSSPDPTILWQCPKGTLRVVSSLKGPVVEIPDGKDAMGQTRWIKAVLSPDRSGHGEVILEGWKQISQALGVTVQTAMLWARQAENRLPVRHGMRGPFIFLSLLRAWVTDRTYPATKASKPSGRWRGKRSGLKSDRS